MRKQHVSTKLTVLLCCVCIAYCFHINLDEFRNNIDSIADKVPKAVIPSIKIDPTKIDGVVNAVVNQCANLAAVSLGIIRKLRQLLEHHLSKFSLKKETNAQGQVINKYTKGYGVLDKSNGNNGPMANADSRFCIGSITKQFTSALVGQTLNKNGVTTLWDTPLEQLVGPRESSMYGQPTLNNQLYTLRDLLAHRSDIPRYDLGWILHPKVDRTTLWKNIHYLRPMPQLSAKWRSSFEYNNWLYTLAGYIAQKWDNRGLQWEDLIRMNYLQPLGMGNTTFMHVEKAFQNWALPAFNRRLYNKSQSGWSPINKAIFPVGSNIAPAGTICTSANDMVKYLAWLTTQNNTSPMLPPKWILRQAQAASNLLSGITTIGKPTLPVDISSPSYGMGWFQGLYRAYRTVGHGGAYFGYLSQLTQYPDLNLGIYVSTTNDVFFGRSKAGNLALAIFDVIMQQNNQWLTPALICAPIPPPYVNTTGFVETCTFNVATKYLTLAGTYNHPLFGSAKVSSTFPGNGQMQIRFGFGNIGSGYLCTTTLDGPNTYALKLDSSSPFGVLSSNAVLDASFHLNMTFNLNQAGFPTSLTLWAMEPRAYASAVTFYPATFTACKSINPCQNAGVCIARGVNDYMCQCPMWFTGRNCQNGPNRDCSDLYKYHGKNVSGMYWIHPTNGEPLQVYCDMTTTKAGWTLIQRRVDSSVSFNQPWSVYLNQFGSLTGNYWMGLNNIYLLTSMMNTNYTIRVDLWDCGGLKAWEQYDNFWISGASDKFRFHVTTGSARGTANNGFTFGASYFTQENVQFSTPDQDNDNSPTQNCAQTYSGGWWYNACYAANLNGLYHSPCAYVGVRNGLEWIPWKFTQYSMKRVEIKIKRM